MKFELIDREENDWIISAYQSIRKTPNSDPQFDDSVRFGWAKFHNHTVPISKQPGVRHMFLTQSRNFVAPRTTGI